MTLRRGRVILRPPAERFFEDKSSEERSRVVEKLNRLAEDPFPDASNGKFALMFPPIVLTMFSDDEHVIVCYPMSDTALSIRLIARADEFNEEDLYPR